MQVRITSNILWPSVSVFDIGAGPKLIHESSIRIKWSDQNCSIHDMFSPIRVWQSVPGYRQNMAVCSTFWPTRRIHLDVLDNLPVPLLVETLTIDRFVKEIFSMERHFIPSQSHTGAIIFRIHSTVGAAGYVTAWLRRRDQYKKQTGQQQ